MFLVSLVRFLESKSHLGINTQRVFSFISSHYACLGVSYTNVIFGLLRVSSLHRIASLLIEYVISMPNMYARGILWGKMVLELGDSCTARNENNGFFSEMQFKTKVRVLFYSNLLQKSEVLTSMFVFFVLFFGGLIVWLLLLLLLLLDAGDRFNPGTRFISVLSSGDYF